MGFLKKALKKIKLRGTLKAVMGVASLIPVVGSYVDKAKKFVDKTGLLEKKKNRAIQEGNEEQAKVFDRQLQEVKSQEESAKQEAYAALPENREPQTFAKSGGGGINIRDILNGALGGALNGAGVAIAGTDVAGNAGATMADSTLSAWIKKNIALVISVAGTLILGTVLLSRRR